MERLYVHMRPLLNWLQRFVLFIAGITVGVFSYTLVASTSVFAVDAEWDNQQIQYNGDSYASVNDTGETARKFGLPEGSRIYAKEELTNGKKSIKIVYFSPGSDMVTADKATAITFTENDNGIFQKDGTEKEISITPAGQNNEIITGSCGVENIGWLICPVTSFLANMMDAAYSGIANFLDAKPLNVTNRKSGIYIAWNIMLGIANAAFIVGFLIIIYSYITSAGISNYGVKRMLPRIVIAAILVNMSFYICAIAIDLSNISGRAFQDMFIEIRNTIATVGEATGEDGATWAGVATVVLAGSSAAVAATGGVLASGLPWLVPALLSAAFAILVVIIVLAVRQALIVILTIISPLAFVCYILPGTEKWFEKWRDLFLTMLIFFPAFSAVFGGSQLAGLVILQNADSIIMTILGLAVQVAPLAIAPLILKLSGGILNRFAGIINNPNRGLIDKSKQWAEKKSEDIRNRGIYGKDGQKDLGSWYNPRGAAKRVARSFNRRSKLLDAQLQTSRMYAENDFMDSAGYRNFDIRKREAEQAKQTIEKSLDKSWNDYLLSNSTALEAEMKLRVTADKAAASAAKIDNIHEELKAGYLPTQIPLTKSASQIMDDAVKTSHEIATQGLRKANAQRALNKQFSEQLLSSESMQKVAGGVYEHGQDAALASAINTMRSDYGKSVEEGAAIVKHFNLNSKQRQDHALGKEVVVTDDKGNERVFKADNVFTREHVIDFQMKFGTVDEVKAIVSRSGSDLTEFRSTISEALAASGVKNKAPYMGGKLIDDVAKGAITSESDLLAFVQDWVKGGKFKDEDIAITDPQGLQLMIDALNAPTTQKREENESLADYTLRQSEYDAKLKKNTAKLRATAATVLDDAILSRRVISDSKPLLEKIRDGEI